MVPIPPFLLADIGKILASPLTIVILLLTVSMAGNTIQHYRNLALAKDVIAANKEIDVQKKANADLTLELANSQYIVAQNDKDCKTIITNTKNRTAIVQTHKQQLQNDTTLELQYLIPEKNIEMLNETLKEKK